MQWVALDGTTSVLASYASKQKNYHCPECRSTLRIRGGPHRQLHFYHLNATPTCRQHKKSQEHLLLQLFLYQSIPLGESQIERPFSSINRIADVAWEAKKMIFEIQCSSISFQEVAERTSDYRSIGYEIIWILHTKRFNRFRMTAAEAHLRKQPCYYSNMDKTGSGIIYDQFEIIQGAKRLYKGAALKVDPLEIRSYPIQAPDDLPLSLRTRWESWTFCVNGDLLDRIQRLGTSWLHPLIAIEKKILTPSHSKASWISAIKTCYVTLLEKHLKQNAK